MSPEMRARGRLTYIVALVGAGWFTTLGAWGYLQDGWEWAAVLLFSIPFFLVVLGGIADRS